MFALEVNIFLLLGALQLFLGTIRHLEPKHFLLIIFYKRTFLDTKILFVFKMNVRIVTC
jgi:hypothetical protein